MKSKLLLLALLACALAAQAQGTLQFNARLTGADEVPPNSDPTIGTATFWLTGDTLTYFIYVPALTFITTGGTVNGPAAPGANAPVLFDLGAFRYHSGSTIGDPPFYSGGSDGPPFGSPFSLTGEQINQLESGLWYVNITSGFYPEGQLRGQILSVPEPSVLGLLGLGLGLLGWRCWRRT